MRPEAPIGAVTARAYTVPTDSPEADGSFAWTRITLVLAQADATRCAGITGFLSAATVCDSHHIALSAHCAPAAHLHAACAAPGIRHVERFHDHVRIEHMFFDGAPVAHDGMIRPARAMAWNSGTRMRPASPPAGRSA